MGDGTVEVREATQDASKAIMSKVSGHAVKLILPTLLSGLEDRQWRSKKGAIEMLGAMANLAPRQLAISLPAIVPRLAEVLTDTHSQVRAAGNASLKRFGEVSVVVKSSMIQTDEMCRSSPIPKFKLSRTSFLMPWSILRQRPQLL